MDNIDMPVAVEDKANGLLQELNSLQGIWVNLGGACDYHSSSQNQNILPVWKEGVWGSVKVFGDRREPASSRFVDPCVYKVIPMDAVQYLTGINAYIVSLNRISGLLITKEKNNDRAGACVPSLGGCHSEFSERLERLIGPSPSFAHELPEAFYDDIFEIISDYYQSVADVPDEITDVFFDFTDLFEGLLLVSKKRSLEMPDIIDILDKMNTIYPKIYSLMISGYKGAIPYLTNELIQLKSEVDDRGLMPTAEEYESELAETVVTLDDDEKRELAGMFSRY